MLDDADPIDDAIEATAFADEGKADSIVRHYLLWDVAETSEPGIRGYYRRAGGGKLRCPDNAIRERCTFDSSDIQLSSIFASTPEQIVDELEVQPMIARGRLVVSDGRVQLRITGLTRAITSVVPTATCYRIRPLTTAGNCPVGSEPFCFDNEFQRLDTSTTDIVGYMSFDEVDPTPDFWGQPTPAVQAKIDDALLLARARPVYTCGFLGGTDPEHKSYTGQQLFAPKS
jgi:hypothetical protein